jgi:hypothetical protein
MHLHRDDIKEMLEILEKFPEAEVVEVVQDSSSGIGSHTVMRLTTEVNNVKGTLEVIISNVENW